MPRARLGNNYDTACRDCKKKYSTRNPARGLCLGCVRDRNEALAKEQRVYYDASDDERKQYLQGFAKKLLAQRGKTAENTAMLGAKVIEEAKRLSKESWRHCQWCGKKFIAPNNQSFCYDHGETEKLKFRNIIAREGRPFAKRRAEEPQAATIFAPPGAKKKKHKKMFENGKSTDVFEEYLTDPDDLFYYRETKKLFYDLYIPETPADVTMLNQVVQCDVRNRGLTKRLLKNDQARERLAQGLPAATLDATEEKYIAEELKNNTKTISDTLAHLGIRKDKREQAGSDKTPKELFDEFIAECNRAYRETNYKLVCADCPKYIKFTEEMHQQELDRVKGIDDP